MRSTSMQSLVLRLVVSVQHEVVVDSTENIVRPDLREANE